MSLVVNAFRPVETEEEESLEDEEENDEEEEEDSEGGKKKKSINTDSNEQYVQLLDGADY
jgi:hypothetical protein